jgi:hypothetical protein
MGLKQTTHMIITHDNLKYINCISIDEEKTIYYCDIINIVAVHLSLVGIYLYNYFGINILRFKYASYICTFIYGSQMAYALLKTKKYFISE